MTNYTYAVACVGKYYFNVGSLRYDVESWALYDNGTVALICDCDNESYFMSHENARNFQGDGFEFAEFEFASIKERFEFVKAKL